MLTLNDAIKACKRADNVQYDLYVELCNLRGEHPGGRNHQDDDFGVPRASVYRLRRTQSVSN